MHETNGRRTFLRTAAGAAAAAGLAPSAVMGAPAKRRYAIVGTGVRGLGTWGRPVKERFSDVVDIVGLCDLNRKRLDAARTLLGADCPTFTSFDEMCAQAKPDLLMVTTVDAFHSEYIVKALDRGIDVITEKPMVIDEKQCQDVLDAEKRAKRKINVAFNYRYSPRHEQIKEILAAGEIGRVASVDFSWYLDTRHGADYFRRWHRLRNRGGTLFVHKSTHHFDLVNWWLDADPVDVVANGRLAHYGKNGSLRHSHCRPCPHKQECAYYFDMTQDPRLMALYASAESEDGYHRDGCVFREDVDIFDTMSASIRYSTGATLTYSLNTFMPIEGYRIAFNGEKGRLEVRDYERQPFEVPEETEIQLIKNFGNRTIVPTRKSEGGHGGGDERLADLIFRGTQPSEHLRLPDSRAGAMSCLTGIAARKSVDESRRVQIADLVRL
jgi:predicted dehydrogenase